MQHSKHRGNNLTAHVPCHLTALLLQIFVSESILTFTGMQTQDRHTKGEAVRMMRLASPTENTQHTTIT
jgi:hypothetical protein